MKEKKNIWKSRGVEWRNRNARYFNKIEVAVKNFIDKHSLIHAPMVKIEYYHWDELLQKAKDDFQFDKRLSELKHEYVSNIKFRHAVNIKGWRFIKKSEVKSTDCNDDIPTYSKCYILEELALLMGCVKDGLLEGNNGAAENSSRKVMLLYPGDMEEAFSMANNYFCMAESNATIFWAPIIFSKNRKRHDASFTSNVPSNINDRSAESAWKLECLIRNESNLKPPGVDFDRYAFDLKNTPLIFQQEYIPHYDKYVPRLEEKGIISRASQYDFNLDTLKIYIHGIGGIGKTSLCNAIFKDEKIAQNFSIRLWFGSKPLADIATCCKHMYLKIMPSEKKYTHAYVKALKDFLENLKQKKWLIVFNDVDDITKFKKYIPGRGGVVILNGRHKYKSEKIKSIIPIKLSNLQKSQAKELILNHAPRLSSQTKNIKVLLDYFDKIKFYPKVLVLVARFLQNNNSLTVKDYLKKHKALMISDSLEDSLRKEARALKSTWKISIAHVSKELQIQKTHIETLMIALSYLKINSTPWEFISLCCQTLFNNRLSINEISNLKEVLEVYSLIDLYEGKAQIHPALAEIFRFIDIKKTMLKYF